jgi:hypothetical protein
MLFLTRANRRHSASTTQLRRQPAGREILACEKAGRKDLNQLSVRQHIAV